MIVRELIRIEKAQIKKPKVEPGSLEDEHMEKLGQFQGKIV